MLFHDAEYTSEEYKRFAGFGHSAQDEVVEMAMTAGVKKLGLFHLNQERTDTEVDKMVITCKKIIADKNGSLDCFAVATDMTFMI